MAIPGFNKGGAAASAKPKNPWLDVKVPGRKAPELDPGDHLLTLESREMDEFNTLKVSLGQVNGGPSTIVYLSFKNPKSAAISKETVLSLGLALVGAESKEEFFAFDPEAAILDYLVNGTDSEFVRGINIEGRRVVAHVSLGGAREKDGVPTGDHFRNYTFSPVAEAEQEVALA